MKKEENNLLTQSAARKIDSVHISALGKKVSSLYELTVSLGNEEAVRGLKAIIFRLTSGGDESLEEKFSSALEQIAMESVETFMQILAISDRLEESRAGAFIPGYIEIVTMLYGEFGIQGVQGLNAAVLKILRVPYEAEDLGLIVNLYFMHDAYKAILNASGIAAAKEQRIAELVAGITARGTDESIHTYLLSLIEK